MSEYEILQAEIKAALEKLTNLQKTCQHQNRKLSNIRQLSSRGTYEDWYDIKCLDCGKFWTEEKSVYDKTYRKIDG